jgi:hypothetical protein
MTRISAICVTDSSLMVCITPRSVFSFEKNVAIRKNIDVNLFN